MRKLTVAASSLLFALGATHGQAHAQKHGWLGTWTTANYGMPADQAATLQKTTQIGTQLVTLRQVVHLSQGGRMVRVRFSNEFGTAPLTISAAHLAFLSAGSSILPKTDRVMTFGGKTAVTIAPGEFVASDAVTERVPIFSDLVISIALPAQAIPSITFHNLALQTAFFAAGDQTGALQLSSSELPPPGLGQPDLTRPVQTPIASRPVVKTSTNPSVTAGQPAAPLLAQSGSWFFLKDVEVDANKKSLAVVCLGDSITDGLGSTTETNRRYPDVLEGLAAQLSKTMYTSVLNAGISGNRLLSDGAGQAAFKRLERDVFSQPGARIAILLEGINDIGGARGALSSQDIIGALTEIANQAHQRGMRIYGATLIPFEGSGYYTNAGEQVRQQVNVFLRSNTVFDGTVDFDKAFADPQHPTRMLPKYDHGDHLHPSDAGYAAMAAAVNLKDLRRPRHR